MNRPLFTACWVSGLWGLVFLAVAASAEAAAPRTVPPARLRGYGEISARFTPGEVSANAPFSSLAVTCETAEKAGILHAKYVSDLHLLGGVQDERLDLPGLAAPIFVIPRQGQVSAFHNGKTVYIVASPGLEGLQHGLMTLNNKWRGAEWTPRRRVPMYLDSWDRHGFRFYYWPFQTPKGTEWRDYDLAGEFDFAKRCNESGLVIWSGDERCDFADGLTNEPFWNWAARAASRRNLPVVVNTQLTDNGAWLLNRFRAETQQRMPGYCGGYYTAGDASHAGLGHLSWSGTEALDAEMAVLQQTWRNFSKLDTTIEYLEPHGELRHGEHDILTEYGPASDRSYRAFLKATHGSLKQLSQRWHGHENALKSWDEVRVPELVHFLGFDGQALDLGGDWRVRYEEFKEGKSQPTQAAPEAWYKPELADDSWPVLAAPDSDIAMFQPRRPAVWRRHFTVAAEWKARHPRAWLYVLSLNRAKDERAPIYVNGQKVGEPVVRGTRHWTVVEVSPALKRRRELAGLAAAAEFPGLPRVSHGQGPGPVSLPG